MAINDLFEQIRRGNTINYTLLSYLSINNHFSDEIWNSALIERQAIIETSSTDD